MAAKILAVVAEFEWESTRSRTLTGQRTAIQQGRWRGGIAPYGYCPVKESRNGTLGWYLEVDPETSEVVHEIRDRVKRETVTAICADLNAREVPSPADAHRIRSGNAPKGSRWRPANAIQILRSRALLGEYHTSDDDTLRSEDTGLPIAKAEPILSRAEWTELQENLDRISRKKVQHRKGVSMLHDVAYCLVCKRKMHHFQSGTRPYYRCSSYTSPEGRCENRMIRAERLEEEISTSLEAVFADEPMMRREVIPGEDHSEELAVIDEQIENLAGNLARVKPESRAAQVTISQLEEREARREELAALPTREDAVQYVPTGETIGEAWRRRNKEERGRFLRDHDVTIHFSHPHGADDMDATLMAFWGRFNTMRDALIRFDETDQDR